jgi:hypothetical protein
VESGAQKEFDCAIMYADYEPHLCYPRAVELGKAYPLVRVLGLELALNPNA